jgi:hypothetical protein
VLVAEQLFGFEIMTRDVCQVRIALVCRAGSEESILPRWRDTGHAKPSWSKVRTIMRHRRRPAVDTSFSALSFTHSHTLSLFSLHPSVCPVCLSVCLFVPNFHAVQSLYLQRPVPYLTLTCLPFDNPYTLSSPASLPPMLITSSRPLPLILAN